MNTDDKHLVITLQAAAREALRDIGAFSRAIVARPLRAYQLAPARAIVDSVVNRRGLSFAVVMSRQAGKNETSAQVEAFLMLRFCRRGGTLVKAAPTYQPQLTLSRLRLETVLNTPWTARLWRRQENAIRLGAARCAFLSAQPGANVVGATADLLLECDEAQDVDPTKWDRDFAPMGASTNVTTVFWGTVWTSATFLARQVRDLERLEAQDGVRRIFLVPWPEVAAEVPAYRCYVEREMARLGADHPLIQTQYALREVDGQMGLFPPARRQQMRGDHPRLHAPCPGRRYVLAIDVGGETLALRHAERSDPRHAERSEASPRPSEAETLASRHAERSDPRHAERSDPRHAERSDPRHAERSEASPLHSETETLAPRHAERSKASPRPSETETLRFAQGDVGGDWGDVGVAQGGAKQDHDHTALTVFEIDSGDDAAGLRGPVYRVVDRRVWAGAPHTTLYGAILDLAREVWRANRLVIDATGLGAGLASFLQRALGDDTVIPVIFTAQRKSELGWAFLALCDTGRFKDHAPDGSAEQNLFWRQVEAAEGEIVAGPGRRLRWAVPAPRLHDDLLVSAALIAALDDAGRPYRPSALVDAGDVLDDIDRGRF